jgi:hypothetical protein
MHYGFCLNLEEHKYTLEIKEAGHYETMEPVEDWQRDFFLLSIC